MHRQPLYWLLVFLLFLSACAMPAAPGPPVAAPPAAISPVPQAGASPAIQESVVITFAAEELVRRIYAPLIERFERENPGIQVQFVTPPTSSNVRLGDIEGYKANCRQLAERADTFLNYSCFFPQHAQQYLSDLRPFVEADVAFDRADYLPGILEQATQPDGALFQLPTTASVAVLSYNKDLFATKGLPEPQPDWNWADLRGAAESLGQQPSGLNPTYGFMLNAYTGVDFAIVAEVTTAGIDLTSESGQQVPSDDPRMVSALQNVADLVRSGAIYHPTGRSTYINQLTELIQNGRVGMWEAGLIPVTTSQPSVIPATTFAVGTVPLPQLPYPLVTGGTTIAMSAGTQHPEAAWRWLSFLSRQDIRVTTMWGPGEGVQLPARRSVMSQTQALEQLDPAVAEAIRVTLSRPSQRTWIPGITSQVQAVLDGRDALQAAQEMQATVVADRAVVAAQPAATPTREPIVVATPVPQAAPVANAVSITFGLYDAGSTGSLRSLLPRFQEAHPNVTVQVVDRSQDGVGSLAEAARQDDCFAWPSPPSTTESLDGLLDLQPLVDADPTLPLTDYPALFLSPFQRDGKLVGLPYRFQPLVLWYNQQAFAQAGLSPPTASWTIEDFVGAAEQLTQGTGEQRRYGFITGMSGPTDIDVFLAAANARPVQGQGSSAQPQFTEPQTVQALQTYLSLVRRSAPEGPLRSYGRGSNATSQTALLVEGRAGLWFNPANQPGTALTTTQMAPPPVGGRVVQPGRDLDGLFISAQTQHADGCWTWLTFLNQHVSTVDGAFPARTSVATGAAFQAGAPTGTTEVYTAYQPTLTGNPADTGLFPPGVDPFWFYRAVDRALQGGDLERELQEAQTLTEAHLACIQGGGQPGTCAKQVDPAYQGFSQ